MITLYSFPPSGNSQKVRIALHFLDLSFDEVTPKGGAHKQPPFTDLNPLGQVPVLVDGKVVLRDSQAILVYLAAAYRPGDWDGRDPAEHGLIAQWLSLASNEIANGPNSLRKAALFGATVDRDLAATLTKRVLDLLERHLGARAWIVGERLTIADLACAPYLALSPQGGVDLADYPNVCSWTDRIAALPSFPAMPGWGAP
jgi:glutathione S-transferase